MSDLKKGTRKRSVLRAILILGVLFSAVQVSYAQVTIGSNQLPNKDALLDLQQDGETKGGLLLPRVLLESTGSYKPMSDHVPGMAVYNTATAGDVTPGFYYNNGSKWLKLFSAEDSFFHMPSTVLPTDENDPAFQNGEFSVELHDIYSKQFGLLKTNIAVSDNTARLPVYTSNELYYFVTYYDDSAFKDVKINTAGILSYKLKAGFTYTENTFMNIVFKVK